MSSYSWANMITIILGELLNELGVKHIYMLF